MAIYFNMDEKHLRKGGRKAPQISMARFLQIMQNRFTKFCAEYDIEIEPDAFQDPTEFNFYDVLYEELEDPSFLGKFIKDVSKINVNFENFDCVEADVGRNGVPYLLIRFGGDWEVPVFCMMYWDGKNIRGYLPTYGNCFNSDKKVRSAFGSEVLTYPYKYTMQENGLTKVVVLHNEDDRDKINWCEVEAHLPSCKMDFDSRVEGYSLNN